MAEHEALEKVAHQTWFYRDLNRRGREKVFDFMIGPRLRIAGERLDQSLAELARVQKAQDRMRAAKAPEDGE